MTSPVLSGDQPSNVSQRVTARDIAFGVDKYQAVFGPLNIVEPPLPTTYNGKAIDDFLNSPDPKYSGKMNWQTHQLTLVPTMPIGDILSNKPSQKQSMWVISRNEDYR